MHPLVKPDNLVEFLEHGVQTYPDNLLFGTKDTEGTYRWLTYREVGRRVDNLRAGLASLGVRRGDAVGIIANNRTEWAVAAFATFGLGARFVPMYEQELLHVWRYIVTDSGVKALFVSKPEIREKVKEFSATIPTLEQILLIDAEGDATMAALEAAGEKTLVPAVHPDPDEIAVLIYTSGTTGEPKGVLLSHGNLTSNSHAGAATEPQLSQNFRSLSILPWAHAYGQTAELYTFVYRGASIGFMESAQTVVDDMAQVRPTFLIAVPRIFNRIYDAVQTKMAEEGGLAKKLFDMGVASARKRRELANEGKKSRWNDLRFAIADKVVFQKIRDKFGGRLQGAVTGSAVMNVEISQFFADIGIPLFDCYGMTETSPAIAMNGPRANRLGSVGKALDRVKVVIDPSAVEPGAQDGEIVVYGPNVMKGYHNKPDKTREVMTPDGGIRTGDRGRLDADGFLYITGRIKEQFKLENGKFVFPAALEEDICLAPHVQQAVIYGENRPYTVCLVVPDFLSLGRYARKRGLPTDAKILIQRSDIRKMISDGIVRLLRGRYGSYEIPKKFVFLAEAFTLENGTLTQTMKLKRKIVFERHRDLIETLYAS